MKLEVRQYSAEKLLKKMVEMGASDLFFLANSPISMKISGNLTKIMDDALSVYNVNDIISQLIDLSVDETETDRDGVKNSIFKVLAEKKELNISINLSGTAYFRVNLYQQKGNYAAVIRWVNSNVPSIEDLGLPEYLKEAILTKSGLIVITGAANSGKSTTAAAMLDYKINQQRCHVITIEDPIEFRFEDAKSIVTQREVGSDTHGFSEALVSALRQAPDVIFIGEVRDEKTMRHALSFAETGHLVVCTLHATNTVQGIARILSFFEKEEHGQILKTLSQSLKLIVGQRLLPGIDGGRCPAVELLPNKGVVSKYIEENNLNKLSSYVSGGGASGPHQSYDSSILRLLKDKRVSKETALLFADYPNDLLIEIRSLENYTIDTNNWGVDLDK